MSLSKELEQKVWEKGKPAPGKDENLYRLDEAGAIMCRHYHKNTNMAWQADHILPRAFLEYFRVPEDKINDICNLQPLQTDNNIKKSDDVPEYDLCMKAKPDYSGNEEHLAHHCIGMVLFMRLDYLYRPYFKGKTLKQAIEAYNAQKK